MATAVESGEQVKTSRPEKDCTCKTKSQLTQ